MSITIRSRNYTIWFIVKFDFYLYCMADTEILWNYGLTYLQKLEERQSISRFTSIAPQIQIQGARSFGIYGIGNIVFWFLHICDKWLFNIFHLIYHYINLAFFSNQHETSVCEVNELSPLCPSPRVRSRFRKSWIEPQSTIRLILPSGT